MLPVIARSRIARKILGGLAAILLMLIVITAMGAATMISSLSEQDADASASASFQPSSTALDEIPANMLRLYLRAADAYGLDWAVLAAIGAEETKHCTSRLAGVQQGENSSGAGGCMQFLQPTFDAYAVDGNRDGVKSRYDPADAVYSAANYLKASGAPRNYRRALFAYNHADWYVNKVLARAATYRGALAAAADTPLALADAIQDAAAVLRLTTGPSPRIILANAGPQRTDLQTGQISPLVTSLLVAIARGGHTITVTALKSDHDVFTSSGSVSNHSAGRAVDIAVVDGEQCDASARGRSGRCWALARRLAGITGRLQVTELIYGFDPAPGFQDANGDGSDDSFARADHRDHIHAGFD